jgi:hypothetical protein
VRIRQAVLKIFHGGDVTSAEYGGKGEQRRDETGERFLLGQVAPVEVELEKWSACRESHHPISLW